MPQVSTQFIATDARHLGSTDSIPMPKAQIDDMEMNLDPSDLHDAPNTFACNESSAKHTLVVPEVYTGDEAARAETCYQ